MASDRGLIQKCFDRKNAHAALRVTMATGRHLLNLVVVFFVTASLACSSGQSAQTQLQIRILNLTKSAMDNLWLGAGPRGGATQDTEFGPIGIGETSDYASLEPVRDNYRKLNFVIDGVRYNAMVELPDQDLVSGSYTFVCTIDGEDAAVSVVAENAQ